MAGKKQFSNGTWQYTFKKSGVLEKPIYLTFSDEKEGDEFARKVEALLSRGIVPTEFKQPEKIATLSELAQEYCRNAHPSKKDLGAFGAILKRHEKVSLRSINAAWVDGWIEEMKGLETLAPATIRARVGAIARCTDWGVRKGFLILPDHPFRTLPDGYAQYSKSDIAKAGVKREDVERDRRLEPGEYERILGVIDGGVLPRQHRPLKIEHISAHKCLFMLAVETAMRLREMYTLTRDQVDFENRTIFLEKTKNGDKRQVPLSSIAIAALREYWVVRFDSAESEMLFPWVKHGASDKNLDDASDTLSKRFKDIFKAAKCPDLRFHDLRHEAVSRLFEKTRLSESQIMKISGHKSHRMMMRYANLRGSTLADSLW